jgi:hypothetical protein
MVRWYTALVAALALALTGAGVGAGATRTKPQPVPIAGGIQVPDGPLVHGFVPGPKTITLPYSKLKLQGRNVEPSTITNRRGFTALGYLVGKARNHVGKRFNVEIDIRAFRGTYVTADGLRRSGLFAFI